LKFRNAASIISLYLIKLSVAHDFQSIFIFRNFGLVNHIFILISILVHLFDFKTTKTVNLLPNNLHPVNLSALIFY
jgi:hypothetical protein